MSNGIMMEIKLKKHYLFFLILSIPLAIFVGSRGSTPDTQIYFDVFKNIDNLNLLNPSDFYSITGMEVGFGWYSWILNYFTNSSIVVFSIFSLINFFFIYKSTQSLKIPYFYTLLFYIPSAYFFMQQFMQMRQGLAISMIVFAVIRILQNKTDFSIFLLILLSFFLHQTTIIFFAFSLLFIFLKNNFLLSPEKIKYTMIVLFFFLTFVFKFFLLDFLISSSGRLQSYSNTDNYSEEIPLFSLPNLKTMIVLIFIIIFSGRTILNNKIYIYFLYLMVIALSARIGFSEFAIMSGRLSTAFSYVEIFILPILFLSRFSKKICIIIGIIFFILQIYITLGFQVPYLIDMYFNPLY